MLDQLKAFIQLLRQCLRVIKAVSSMPLCTIKADNAADATHNGKELNGTDGNPVGLIMRRMTRRY